MNVGGGGVERSGKRGGGLLGSSGQCVVGFMLAGCEVGVMMEEVG